MSAQRVATGARLFAVLSDGRLDLRVQGRANDDAPAPAYLQFPLFVLLFLFVFLSRLSGQCLALCRKIPESGPMLKLSRRSFALIFSTRLTISGGAGR